MLESVLSFWVNNLHRMVSSSFKVERREEEEIVTREGGKVRDEGIVTDIGN